MSRDNTEVCVRAPLKAASTVPTRNYYRLLFPPDSVVASLRPNNCIANATLELFFHLYKPRSPKWDLGDLTVTGMSMSSWHVSTDTSQPLDVVFGTFPAPVCSLWDVSEVIRSLAWATLALHCSSHLWQWQKDPSDLQLSRCFLQRQFCKNALCAILCPSVADMSCKMPNNFPHFQLMICSRKKLFDLKETQWSENVISTDIEHPGEQARVDWN